MEDLHMYKTEITLHDTTYLRLSVVVEVCQLEGRALDVTEVEIRIVVHDNVVRGRVDGSLPHGLRHQEEVISLWEGNNVIDHSSTWRIVGVTVHLEEPGVDPLADDDVSELQLVLSCIDYSPTWGIAWLAIHLEEPGVDPLADNDVSELQLVLSFVSLHEALLDGGNLMIHNVGDLSISNTIP